VLTNVDPLYIRYSDGMEVLEKRLTKKLYLTSFLCVTHCRQAEECNYSEQRWDDVYSTL